MRLPLLACLLTACLAPAAEEAGIQLRERETVVVYGDSITEQNLYAAYIETWLRTRFPAKELSLWNFGWSGDTAAGGNDRFARDAAAVHPTLVLVDFGMNDGAYRAPDQGIRERYLGAQRALAATIAASGAREVLLTTSPIDPTKRPDGDAYNEALALMADGVLALGQELKIPVVDLFHPMRELQRQAQAAHAGFSMIPDSVHPDPVGHLVMAYHVLRRVAGAGPVGSLTLAEGKVTASSGASVANLVARDGGLEFDLHLPCLPMHVPPEARGALALVPFQAELNALVLTIPGVAGTQRLSVDGVEVASLDPARLAAGLDLASLDKAPWMQQAAQVWRLAQLRWNKHFDAWRTLGLHNPDLGQVRSVTALRSAEADFVRGVESDLRALAQPRAAYHVVLAPDNRVAIAAVELSPVYPIKRSDFAAALPPETGAEVAWKRAALDPEGAIDLNAALGNPSECAVYARIRLQAAAPCRLRLSLGSDDGLIVIANRKRILEHDIYRGMAAGQDQAVAELAAGENTLLLRVNNGDGGYGLSVQASVMGDTAVTVLP